MIFLSNKGNLQVPAVRAFFQQGVSLIFVSSILSQLMVWFCGFVTLGVPLQFETLTPRSVCRALDVPKKPCQAMNASVATLNTASSG